MNTVKDILNCLRKRKKLSIQHIEAIEVDDEHKKLFIIGNDKYLYGIDISKNKILSKSLNLQ